MTEAFALQRNWKIGETVYAIIHKMAYIPGIDKFVPEPVDIREITVKEVVKDDTRLIVNFDVPGEHIHGIDDCIFITFHGHAASTEDSLACKSKIVYTSMETAKLELATQKQYFRMNACKQLEKMKEKANCLGLEIDELMTEKWNAEKACEQLNDIINKCKNE